MRFGKVRNLISVTFTFLDASTTSLMIASNLGNSMLKVMRGSSLVIPITAELIEFKTVMESVNVVFDNSNSLTSIPTEAENLN